MYNQFLTPGISWLSIQSAVPEKIRFTNFVCGDAINFEMLPSMTNVEGNVTYLGTAAQMGYVKVSSQEALICARVEHTVAPKIGNILYVVDNQYPMVLFMARAVHQKTATDDKVVGDRYTFQFRLRIPGLHDLFSFDNLPDFTSKWTPTYDDQFTVAVATEDVSNQGLIREHTDMGRAVLLNNGGMEEWWGNPLMQRMDDTHFFEIDGGTAGNALSGDPITISDNYKYIPKL